MNKAIQMDGQKIWKALLQPSQSSLEYRQWRDRLLRRRFWLAIGLAVAYLIIQGVADFYEVFVNAERLLQNLQLIERTDLLPLIQQHYTLHKVTAIVLLIGLSLLWNWRWIRKHPAMILILFPWAVAFIPEIILGAFIGIPHRPSLIMFMAQVAIAPVYWQLHLISQAVPILFYLLVYPLLGLASFAGQSIYSFSSIIEIILVCIICEVGVYLFEQSKRLELEANRRLQLCIHSITHDLRTPVMGSLMLLKSIRQHSSVNQPIEISQTEMEQLIQGGDRLLHLMNSLLIPQAFSYPELVLQCHSTHLSAIVNTVLKDFHPSLVKQNVRVNNGIQSDLPLVNVDAQQIGRVFKNLIGNAISHNPSGISLTLNAKRSRSMLKVTLEDNGIGIPFAQQETLFEPYMRGQQTQYLPGLGLGLYICRQVIVAHGGAIGVQSLTQGTMFWFTLPLSEV
ncbi:sensor histidine kinase [Vacuolonema iberomarrocanum]|uniref:sensor histidine kinase n=1 Tax=Vacuolonema iberomarrocanum TaxID=3454632 RepID=UPI003F6DE485